MLITGSGAEVADFRYDSFGNLRSSTGVEGDREELAGGDFRFQGQWLESTTDLYHFRARYYDPESGRFVSRDPVELIEYEPESSNPYQFVYNNPHIYLDPTGEFTIAELNASNQIQDILRAYRNDLARDFLREKTGEIFSNVAWGIINQILPGTVDGDDLFSIGDLDPDFGGSYLEDFLQNNLCSLLPSILKERLWLTPVINTNGVVKDPGFHCGDENSTINNISNPDFLFEQGSPKPVKKANPQSYLIGDVKFTISQAHDGMKKPKKQWLAMANHAEEYQALKLTSFVTFRTTVNSKFKKDPTYQITTLKDMQKRAVDAGVVLFIANIYD